MNNLIGKLLQSTILYHRQYTLRTQGILSMPIHMQNLQYLMLCDWISESSGSCTCNQLEINTVASQLYSEEMELLAYTAHHKLIIQYGTTLEWIQLVSELFTTLDIVLLVYGQYHMCLHSHGVGSCKVMETQQLARTISSTTSQLQVMLIS